MFIKLSSLPLHHIDTSVILEEATSKEGFYCKKYLNIVGYKYRGVVSFPVLSELFFKILNLTTFDEQWDTFDLINSIIREKRISFYSPKDISEIDKRIKEMNITLDSLDRQILACAVENNATLVTIDSKLLRSEEIQKEFDIKIRHPKELI